MRLIIGLTYKQRKYKMAHIEEITQLPIRGQRFATNVSFHGGKIHRGEGILTVISSLFDEDDNAIPLTEKYVNIVLKDLMELDLELFKRVDLSLRQLCDKLFEPKPIEEVKDAE